MFKDCIPIVTLLSFAIAGASGQESGSTARSHAGRLAGQPLGKAQSSKPCLGAEGATAASGRGVPFQPAANHSGAHTRACRVNRRPGQVQAQSIACGRFRRPRRLRRSTRYSGPKARRHRRACPLAGP